MPDIKDILDSIIDGANNKFPNDVNSTMHQNMGVKMPQTFDEGKFREKLSLYVLRDVISAMMHDETKDLDGMIDHSIQRHIRDNYKCGCYDYLCRSRNKLNSPILSDIIQEIDQKTMEVRSAVTDPESDGYTSDMENLKKELPEIENYEELRQRLKDVVSRKVVKDVSKAITQSNDAPVFDDLDEKLVEKNDNNEEVDQEEGNTPGEDVATPETPPATSESCIMNIYSRIVTEGAVQRINVSYEDGMNMAIVEFCLAEMDYLFKMDPTHTIIEKWDNPRPIQEGFFDIFTKKKCPTCGKRCDKNAKFCTNCRHKFDDKKTDSKHNNQKNKTSNATKESSRPTIDQGDRERKRVQQLMASKDDGKYGDPNNPKDVDEMVDKAKKVGNKFVQDNDNSKEKFHPNYYNELPKQNYQKNKTPNAIKKPSKPDGYSETEMAKRILKASGGSFGDPNDPKAVDAFKQYETRGEIRDKQKDKQKYNKEFN